MQTTRACASAVSKFILQSYKHKALSRVWLIEFLLFARRRRMSRPRTLSKYVPLGFPTGALTGAHSLAGLGNARCVGSFWGFLLQRFSQAGRHLISASLSRPQTWGTQGLMKCAENLGSPGKRAGVVALLPPCPELLLEREALV